MIGAVETECAVGADPPTFHASSDEHRTGVSLAGADGEHIGTKFDRRQMVIHLP